MKLTVIPIECPYPPIHGGRVDVWHRLQAFAAEGVKIQLVFWHAEDDAPNKSTMDALLSVCDSVLAFPISRAWSSRFRALSKLASQSLYVSTRELSAENQKKLEDEYRKFSPDAIWLDAVFGGKLAFGLAEKFNKHVFYRSHNIEFQYRQKQFKLALGAREKLAVWMSMSNLEQFELSVMKRAAFVWDISLDDLRYWQTRGIENSDWLPPFANPSLVEDLRNAKTAPEFDFAYLGNLYTPNNIEGISWFLEKVWRRIREKKAARFLLAGINPHPKIQNLARETEGVMLQSDAPTVAEVYAQGKVLINPILAGSGMNVKSVEMLFSGKPVVTCPQGTAGLPDKIRSYFDVADSPEEFAKFCLSALEIAPENMTERDLSAFTFQAIKPVIEQMQKIIRQT